MSALLAKNDLFPLHTIYINTTKNPIVRGHVIGQFHSGQTNNRGYKIVTIMNIY